MQRRSFLGAALGAAAVGTGWPGLAASGPASDAALGKRRGAGRRLWRGSRGLQLFTVGALLEADFAGTLAQVAAAGYREVETVGSFGRDPHALRAQLDELGLSSPSQHIASDEVYASFGAWTRREITTQANRENYERAFAPDRARALVADGIAKARVLGQTYVTWPILMPRMLADRAILNRYLSVFELAGRMCRDAGLVFAFHNHHREFQKLGGDTIYDLILAGTDPELVRMEMDFYWFAKAACDPVPYLRAQGERYFGCHLKDMDKVGEIAVAGSGALDLPRLLTEAGKAGVRHVFVEYDRSENPLSAIRQSMAYLDAAA